MINFLELTRSSLRRNLLAYFFTNPHQSHYLREVATILNTDPGNLSKELTRLVKEGVFNSEERGRQKYFTLNKDYPLYGELKSMIFKTIGLQGVLKESLKNIAGIRIAFIYGSYAKRIQDALSDIDLLLIIDPKKFNEDILIEKISAIERRLSRTINYSYYPEREWSESVKEKEGFPVSLLKEPKIMLIGKEDELQRFD